MENEGIVHSTIIYSAPSVRTFIFHSPFSNYKIGPEPSSFSLVMDLITTV